MFKIDSSKFKKIKSDKNSTILKHDDGHEVTIVHRHLHPDMLKQIAKLPLVNSEPEKMAEGGSPSIDQNKAKQIQKGATESGYQPDKWKANLKSAFGMADGGQVADKGPYIDPKKAEEFTRGFNKSGWETMKENLHNLKAQVSKPFKDGTGPHDDSIEAPKSHKMRSINYAEGGTIKQSNPKLEESKKEPPKPSGFDEFIGHMQRMGQMLKNGPASGYAEGGDVQKFAFGSDDQVSSEVPQQDLMADIEKLKSDEQNVNGQIPDVNVGAPAPIGYESPSMAKGFMADPANGQQMEHHDMDDTFAESSPTSNPAPNGAPLPQLNESSPLPVSSDRDLASASRSAVGAQPSDLPANTDELSQRGMKAFGDEYKALSGINKANQVILDNQAKDQALLNESHAKTEQKLNGMIEGLSSAIESGKIDPNRVWNSKGAAGKISTVVGLLLGGLGAGLSRGENQAAKSLDNMISQDIEAQKANLGNKHNLLSEANRMMGNARDGHRLATLQLADLANKQMQAQINKLQDPLLKARMEKQRLDWSQPYVQMHQQLVANTNAASMANQAVSDPGKIPAFLNSLSKVEPKHAEALTRQYLQSAQPESLKGVDPSVFVPRVVPEPRQKEVFTEIERAQDTKKLAGDIMKAFDNAAHNVHVADFVPGAANADQKALHALMGPTFKDVEGTVRQAAMDNMNKNTTPQFGDNKNTIKTKRNALMGYLQSKSSAPTAKGFGIDLDKFNSTTPIADIKTYNGHTYQKVQGGWKLIK